MIAERTQNSFNKIPSKNKKCKQNQKRIIIRQILEVRRKIIGQGDEANMKQPQMNVEKLTKNPEKKSYLGVFPKMTFKSFDRSKSL